MSRALGIPIVVAKDNNVIFQANETKAAGAGDLLV